MKYAFALSGGGFKGGYQVGAINALYDSGIQPSFIAGTSTGALQAVMLAQNKLPQLNAYWDLVQQNGYDEIWDSWLVKEVDGGLGVKVGGIAEVLITGKLFKRSGLGTLRPLREKLAQDIKREDFVIPMRCGVTSLTDGSYHTIDPMQCATNEDIVQAILASASMPIIWEPVPLVNLKGGGLAQLSDGGLQSITPIKECIDFINAQPDAANWKLIPITCSTDEMEAHPMPYALLGIAGRTLELMLNKLFQTDLDRFRLINTLVESSGLESINGYRNIPNLIIQPSQATGSTLDSRKEVIQFRRDLGYQDTMNLLNSLATFI